MSSSDVMSDVMLSSDLRKGAFTLFGNILLKLRNLKKIEGLSMNGNLPKILVRVLDSRVRLSLTD